MATNPLSNLDKYEVLLASNSPRRRQLLADLGVTFRSVALSDIDESYPSDTPALDVAIVVARKKAEAYSSLISSNQLIITATSLAMTAEMPASLAASMISFIVGMSLS